MLLHNLYALVSPSTWDLEAPSGGGGAGGSATGGAGGGTAGGPAAGGAAPGTGGAGPGGGAAPVPSAAVPESGGCGCRSTGAAGSLSWLSWMWVAALLVTARRRRLER